MKTLLTILITASVICLTTYALSAQNAPICTIGTVETYNDSVVVSVTVADFTNIGACDLLMVYDSTIANATSIELGPGVGQFFFVTDVDTTGKIYLSWLFFQYGVPGLTLPDSSVFLKITFERIDYGLTAIEFDNSLPDNCLFTDGNFDILNDIPNSTYYIDGSLNFKMIDAPVTGAPIIEICPGSSVVDIPVVISEFSQIGAFTLTMQYNAAVFSYQSFTNVSGFPILDLLETSPGIIVAEGFSSAPGGVTLSSNSVLFTIHFNNLGGSTGFNWMDNGESCAYFGPAPMYEPRNDSPQSSFYVDGVFNELPLPSPAGIIEGPDGGTVCMGDTNVVFSVDPILNATGYEWELPDGAVIESGVGTPEIIVSFGINAQNGDVIVYGINECGNGIVSPAFQVIVEIAPNIVIQPVTPDTIYAGAGVANLLVTATGSALAYQWQEFSTEWADIIDDVLFSGTMTSQLIITNPPVTMNGNKYRCVVSGNCEPAAISDGNAMLTVVLPVGYSEQNFNEDQGDKGLNITSFPNPFIDHFTFGFISPSKGTVEIEINNMYGEKVAYKTKQIEGEGNHNITFNEKKLSHGIYFVVISFRSENLAISNTLKIIAGK